LLQFGVNPRSAGYDPDRTRLFYHKLHERLNALPGVRSAGISEMAILSNNEWDMWVAIEGLPFHPGEVPDPHFNAVSPGYMESMGMNILSGRAFTVRDDSTAPTVAIVNQKFARKYFGGGQAVGKHLGIGGDPTTRTNIEIVGVVNDARYESLRDQIPEEVFLSTQQRQMYGETFYVLAERDPRSLFAPIRALVREVDPSLPIQNMKTFDRQLADSLITERLTATLATVFGLLATALVLIGLYGVMSFMVARRSREIGIRLALGAVSGHVVWIVMRETLLLIATGFAIGLPAAYALTQVVRAQLYGIEPGDPASVAIACVLLAVVTAAAGFIPARRAAGFDPWRILRHE
jgi:predicted permease